ncbi:hypothetical protein [Amycolatopsis lexingtonensis]|uniref:hypothetical protein n=1 Tax=Amycolatopsis lexingtonensis TaxID=218822 RepID=UPI003F6EBD65
MIGRYEKSTSLAAIVLASALALTGCSESGQASAPDGPPSAQQSAKPTVHELYREFLVGLNDRDAKRVCPLFTPDGQATFAKEWEATTCEGAVDRAAARFGDMSNVIAKAGEKKIQEKNGVAEFGSDSCTPGRLSARKDDAGWLLFDYSFAGGGCMG